MVNLSWAQAAGAEDAAPPVGGVGAQLVFFAFLVVMLLVPWLMARGANSAESARATPAAGPAPPRLGDETDSSPSPFFTSERERRLWIWTGLVLAAIYLTLGPVAELAAALRARNLLGLTSTVFLVAVALVIAIPWARRRPGRIEIGAAIGVAAAYLTTVVRLPVPEARSHLFEYGVVAMLIYHALTERRANGRRVPVPAIMAFLATVLLGWLDEVIQALIPNRTYDILDVGLNAAFAFMAIVAVLFMGWARRLDVLGRLRRSGDGGRNDL